MKLISESECPANIRLEMRSGAIYLQDVHYMRIV